MEQISDTANTLKTETGNTTESLFFKSRSRAWTFTLNNYNASDIDYFTDTLDTEKYMFQEETGEEGTPHLQGTVYFKNARTGKQMKQLHSKVHWEATKCIKGSVAYCCKQETRTGEIYAKGWKIPKQLKLIEELRPWQQEVIDITKTEADDRTIHWFYDPAGRAGKTVFSKYLAVKTKGLYYFRGGKSSDIGYQIVKRNEDPQVCIFDYPRDEEYNVNYNCIEMVKDGMIHSSKFEGGMYMCNSPHVIIFANKMPSIKKMTSDKWKIHHLSSEKDLEKPKEISHKYYYDTNKLGTAQTISVELSDGMGAKTDLKVGHPIFCSPSPSDPPTVVMQADLRSADTSDGVDCIEDVQQLCLSDSNETPQEWLRVYSNKLSERNCTPDDVYINRLDGGIEMNEVYSNKLQDMVREISLFK